MIDYVVDASNEIFHVLATNPDPSAIEIVGLARLSCETLRDLRTDWAFESYRERVSADRLGADAEFSQCNQ
jgi:hypothetical protein